jgi:hypothetical protein
MKRIVTRLSVLFLVAGCMAPPEIGTVEEGSGTVRMDGGSVWKIAESGSILLERDDVKTGAKESLVMRVHDAVLAMNENSHLTLGSVSDEGFRGAEYWKGDLFMILEAPTKAGWLLECGAGKVLVHHGVVILRLDPLGGPKAGATAGEETPSRLQIVVVRGKAVVENVGLARTLKGGELGYLFTGAPPTTPTVLSPKVIEDFEWALDQTLGREPGPAWPRPPLYDLPRTTEETPPPEGPDKAPVKKEPGPGEGKKGKD